MDLKKAKPSKNVIDMTSDEARNQEDWLWLLGAHDPRNGDRLPDEAFKGLTPEDLKAALWKRVMESYGDDYLNAPQYRKNMRYGQ